MGGDWAGFVYLRSPDLLSPTQSAVPGGLRGGEPLLIWKGYRSINPGLICCTIIRIPSADAFSANQPPRHNSAARCGHYDSLVAHYRSIPGTHQTLNTYTLGC